MRGEVKLVKLGIPKAIKAVGEAKSVIVDTLAFDLFRLSKESIRGVNLVDTGAMQNSAYVDTTRGMSGMARAVADATAKSKQPGAKSGQPSFPLKIAQPGRELQEGEARVAYAVEYAIYWEFGFGTKKGNSYYAPFLGPAAEQLKRDAPAKAKKILEGYLKDALK
jgi:hypothetical protein